MNRIGVATFLLLAMLLTSCSRKYRVEGTSSLINLDGKVLYLKMLQNGMWVPVDSSEVVHGCFKMKGPVDSVRMVTLYLNNEALMPLVLENGKVKVSESQITVDGVASTLLLYSVSGAMEGSYKNVSSVDISGLGRGVYVALVNVDGKNIIMKFRK